MLKFMYVRPRMQHCHVLLLQWQIEQLLDQHQVQKSQSERYSHVIDPRI